jgi:hypothetical protein
LCRLCSSAEGSRSISDLSRTAVQRLISGEERDADTHDLLLRLNTRMCELKESVAQLLQVVATPANRPESRKRSGKAVAAAQNGERA